MVVPPYRQRLWAFLRFRRRQKETFALADSSLAGPDRLLTLLTCSGQWGGRLGEYLALAQL
jgi:hypothetical protein